MYISKFMSDKCSVLVDHKIHMEHLLQVIHEKTNNPISWFKVFQDGLLNDIEEIWEKFPVEYYEIANDFFCDEKVQRILQSEFHQYISKKEIHFRDFIEIIFETPSTLIPYQSAGGTDEDIHTILHYFRRCGYFFDMGEQRITDLENFAGAYNFYWENLENENNPSTRNFKEIYEGWQDGGKDNLLLASYAVSILCGSFEYNILHSKADSYKHFEDKIGYRF